jgi:hypothetical protein
VGMISSVLAYALDAHFTTDLKLLESVQGQFKPEDAVLEHSHLFSSYDPNVPDTPMKPYEDGWDEWIGKKREEAVKTVYDQMGLSGIFRLAETAVLPDSVGYVSAQLRLAQNEEIELLQRGFSSEPICYPKNPLTSTARAYAWNMYRKEGEKWMEDVLARPNMNWTPEVYANLALGLPPSPSLWDRLDHWGQQADTLYWRNVEIRSSVLGHWPRVLEKWKEVTRPWSSLELLARLVDERHADTTSKKPSAEQVMDILDQTLSSGENVEPLRQKGQMLDHYVERLFLFLDTQAVDPERMAQLEWSWLQIIEHTKRGAKVLPRQSTSSPRLFCRTAEGYIPSRGRAKEGDSTGG